MRPSLRLAHVKGVRRLGRDVLESAHVHRTSTRPAISSPASHGLLSDWPVSVKDNFCTLEMPTSCSSKMLEKYQSPFEATAVKLIRQAGAQILAKTNCDEFGMGSANLYSAYGPVYNPESWKGEERVAGGSSGGAAASVAAGGARIALASDTGGSVRTPAAYCGVLGLKPSYGLISRWGLVSYADSLDTVGLMGSNVSDIKLAFELISQYDVQDPTSIPAQVRDRAQVACKAVIDIVEGGSMSGLLSGLRVGIPREFFPFEVSKDMLPVLRETLGLLKSMGAEIVSVQIPSTRYALSAYYVLASAEASSNLARYDGIRYGRRADARQSPNIEPESSHFHAHISKTRSDGFGAEVQKRILLGTYSLTSDLFDNYFLQAQKVRKLIRQDFDRVFRIPNVLNGTKEGIGESGIDVLITPSAVDIAPTLEEAANMGIQAYTQDLLTVPASLAGLPAMSFPAGQVHDMPVGVTLTSQWGCEEVLFRVAEHLKK